MYLSWISFEKDIWTCNGSAYCIDVCFVINTNVVEPLKKCHDVIWQFLQMVLYLCILLLQHVIVLTFCWSRGSSICVNLMGTQGAPKWHLLSIHYLLEGFLSVCGFVASHMVSHSLIHLSCMIYTCWCMSRFLLLCSFHIVVHHESKQKTMNVGTLFSRIQLCRHSQPMVQKVNVDSSIWVLCISQHDCWSIYCILQDVLQPVGIFCQRHFICDVFIWVNFFILKKS